MRIKLFSIFSLLIVGFFLFLAFGSGESGEKVIIDINDQQALEKYIQGKWAWEKYTSDVNHTWRYRFEIIGNKLKIWSCFNNTDDPFDMSGGYEELTFTLGRPTRDVDGYKARYLEFNLFDKTNFFGLTYEALSPIWLVSDDNWDKPVLRCASGIPSWSREEFQATGNKITHGKNYSSSEETNMESDYSSSNTYNDEDNQTMINTQEQNLEEENNTNSSNNENSYSKNPKFKIYDLGYIINYTDAESKCRNRNMRLPNYNELLEIANSPDLMRTFNPNDKSESYWSSTDYIEGESYRHKEQIGEGGSKIFKKNYNPFTEKTTMTDTRMLKNCLCIE